MSLVSQAIAVTATNLLLGKTWAGVGVMKQPIDPIGDVLRAAEGTQKPMLAVFVETADFMVEGRMTSGKSAVMTLKIFCYVAPGRIDIPADNSSSPVVAQLTLDTGVAGLTLDIMGRQIDAAFHVDGPWVRIWDKFVAKVLDRGERFLLVEIESGIKVPTIEVTYKITTSPDPLFGMDELPEGWAMLDTALRAQGPDGTNLADLFKASIMRPAGLADYQDLVNNFGLTPAGLTGSGLGPQDLASVDPMTGATPLLTNLEITGDAVIVPED